MDGKMSDVKEHLSALWYV